MTLIILLLTLMFAPLISSHITNLFELQSIRLIHKYFRTSASLPYVFSMSAKTCIYMLVVMWTTIGLSVGQRIYSIILFNLIGLFVLVLSFVSYFTPMKSYYTDLLQEITKSLWAWVVEWATFTVLFFRIQLNNWTFKAACQHITIEEYQAQGINETNKSLLALRRYLKENPDIVSAFMTNQTKGEVKNSFTSFLDGTCSGIPKIVPASRNRCAVIQGYMRMILCYVLYSILLSVLIISIYISHLILIRYVKFDLIISAE